MSGVIHNLEAMAARVLSNSHLAELLGASKPLCILDVRPFMQYNTNHVQNAINFPLSRLMLRRIASNGLDGFLTAEAKESLSGAATVVLYDSQTVDSTRATSLQIVVDALESLVASVSFLCGGFQAFESAFPDLCKQAAKEQNSTCAQVTCPNPMRPLSSQSNCPFNFQRANASASSRDALATPVHGPCDECPEPAELAPHLFLGSIQHASDQDAIAKAGITAILNVSSQCKNYSPDRLYKQIAVEDSYSATLLPHFQDAVDFIESVRKANGRVLVHCVGGVSRSPTFCMAYFVLQGLMSVDEAYAHVKARRPVVGPHFGFMGELKILEERLNASRQSKQDCSQSCRNDSQPCMA